MTLREQLLEEIEVAPDHLLEELLTLCRKWSQSAGSQASIVDTVPNPLESIKRIQTKLKLVNPDGQSLVDELIAERRSEAANE